MALALLAAGVPAGSDPQATAPVEFAASITVVTLPVFVTDHDGRAAAGLLASDFEVLDDGRPMKIVGFREIDAAEANPDPEALKSPAARRQFLLLFDLSFSGVAGLVRARQAAQAFVETGLRPSDLAAVATLSANHGVKLLVGFTSDRGQLRKAIATLGVLRLDRRSDPLGLVYDLTDVGSALADTATGDTGRVEFEDTVRQIQIRYQQAEKASHRQRVLGVLDGMEQLARSLDAVQGRKQVVLLSSGFDAAAVTGEPNPELQSQTSDAVARGRFWEVRSEDRFGDSGLRAAMERSFQSFASSDSVVHAVDLSGLSARGDTRFQTREPPRGAGHESLARIANISGGRLFKDTNDPGAALREVLEISRRYYLLAFEPQAARGPGRHHKLSVRLRKKGLRVSHRSGYFEREAFAQRPALARQFEAAEVIAKGVTGGEIGLRAMAVPYRDTAGRLTLPVVLELDGESLLKGRSGDSLALEVYGYAVDEQGGVEDLVALASNLSLAKVGAKIRERGVQCHATFTLRPGRHSLRFLVRDAEAGRSGSHFLEVTLPPFDRGHVLLFPPLFMDDPQRWIVLQAPSRSTQAAESPFQVAADAFTPRTRPRLVNGEAQSVCLLAFDGGARYDPGASFEIKPQLVDSSGTPVPVGRFQLARSVAGTDGFRRFVLSFTPTGVPPGDYTLRVSFRDPASGRLSESYQTVRVD
jgi:VWFA-related protein